MHSVNSKHGRHILQLIMTFAAQHHATAVASGTQWQSYSGTQWRVLDQHLHWTLNGHVTWIMTSFTMKDWRWFEIGENFRQNAAVWTLNGLCGRLDTTSEASTISWLHSMKAGHEWRLYRNLKFSIFDVFNKVTGVWHRNIARIHLTFVLRY